MTSLHQSQLTLGAGEGEGVGGRDRRPHAVQHGGGVAARAVSPQANLRAGNSSILMFDTWMDG